MFGHPDEIGRRWIDLTEGLVRVQAVDIVAAKGERCAECTTGIATRIKRGNSKPGRGQFVWICSDCRAPWRGKHSELIRRWVQEPPTTNTLERRLCRAIDEVRILREIIETPARKDARGLRVQPKRWAYSLACWIIYLEPRFSSYTKTAQFGTVNLSEEFPPEWWTERQVRDAVGRVRGVVGLRATRAKLLIERAPTCAEN